jgi:uncharacterized SAM-binding protein YcdF (DUF218 family)
MAALVRSFFSPSGPIVVLVIAAIWLSRRPSSTMARRFVIAAAVAYALASLHIVPFGISRLLTFGYHQFKASDVEPGTTAVVVLGGGDEFVDGWTDQITVTTNIEAARVLETRRVFRLISPAWIISSGGHPNPDDRAQVSSLTMRDELVRLGVPQERILLESASRNTYDEAVLLAPMLRSLGIQQLVLVTSDTHMRRSLGAFRAVGLNAVPAIAPDPRLPTRWFWWIVPTGDGLESSGEVIHELLGIPYYWLRGRWR